MQPYQVLPLKYRPQTIDEIWIQEHIKTTLKRAIETNRVAHAYLFAGPRGVGKTTTARILAKSLNCKKGSSTTPCQECSVCKEITNSSSLDVLEIDGASNRGIDQVRELRENVKFLPTSCPYKIYIIDEVHMLTQEAFNALLKTLEEPPPHVKFIFATTAPQKVPATILSRCQRFDFRKATIEEIVQRLSWICKQEKIQISEEALFAISKRAGGSIRDGESMLDQLRVYKSDKIELNDVEELLGIISSEIFFQYTDILLAGNQRQAYEFIDKTFQTGYDFVEFYIGLLEHFRLLLMVKLNVNKNILGISHSDFKKYEDQSKEFSVEKILVLMRIIANNEEIVKRTTEPKILFEILSLILINAFTNNQKADNLNTVKITEQTSEIKKIWENITDELSQKRPFLASHLENATISELTDDKVVICFDKKSSKDFLETEKSEIEKYFGAVLNRKITVILTCKTSDEQTKNTTVKKEIGYIEQNVENKPDASKQSKEQKINNDPDKIFRKIFPSGKKIK